MRAKGGRNEEWEEKNVWNSGQPGLKAHCWAAFPSIPQYNSKGLKKE